MGERDRGEKGSKRKRAWDVPPLPHCDLGPNLGSSSAAYSHRCIAWILLVRIACCLSFRVFACWITGILAHCQSVTELTSHPASYFFGSRYIR